MKAIKALVIIMTTLIVFGLVFLAYGLLNSETKKPVSIDTAEIKTKQYGTAYLKEPEGSKIVAFHSSAGKLFLQITGGNMKERIVTVDSSTGEIVGTIALNYNPAISQK